MAKNDPVLAHTVHVGGRRYVTGTYAADIPPADLNRIRNPEAWKDGNTPVPDTAPTTTPGAASTDGGDGGAGPTPTAGATATAAPEGDGGDADLRKAPARKATGTSR